MEKSKRPVTAIALTISTLALSACGGGAHQEESRHDMRPAPVASHQRPYGSGLIDHRDLRSAFGDPRDERW